MNAFSETGTLQLLGFIVTLVIMGVVPYQIARLNNKNTLQHLDGNNQRIEQMKVLEKISVTQDNLGADVLIIKGKVYDLEELRHLDKKEFLDLYERVINNVKS